MTSLKKNLMYNTIYQVLIIILPLITAPYISRVLGVDGLGTYSYIYSIAYYFGICGMLGISNHGSRCIALNKHDNDKVSSTFSNLYFIQLITTCISLVIYIVFVVFFFNGDKTIALIDTVLIISYVLDINWLFFGLEQFKITVTRNIVIKLATVICIFLFVKTKSDLWLYTLIMSSGTCFSQIYLWLKTKKYIKIKKPEWNEIKRNVKPVFVLFIPIIAYSIYKVMDKIMIGAFSTVYEVGLYENADRIVNIPVGLITAFGTVMLPRVSALISSKDNDQIEKYNRMSFKYLTMLSCSFTFGLIGISGILAPVYFGEDFTQSSFLISGLSITLIFVTWANIIRTQYLIPNKNDRPYVLSTIIGAVVNLIINLCFIPLWGSKGALLGTIVAECSVFVVQCLLVRKDFPVFRYIKQTIPFFFIGSIMCLGVYELGNWLGQSILTLILQLLSGVIIYASLTAFLFIITKDELITSLLKKFKKKKTDK